MHAARSVDIPFAALLPSLMVRSVIDEVALVVSMMSTQNMGIPELLPRTWFGVEPLRTQVLSSIAS